MRTSGALVGPESRVRRKGEAVQDSPVVRGNPLLGGLRGALPSFVAGKPPAWSAAAGSLGALDCFQLRLPLEWPLTEVVSQVGAPFRPPPWPRLGGPIVCCMPQV